MATCKECVHVAVCSYAQNSNNEFEHCANFRDRSRFVELPCFLGDTVYRIKGNTVRKERVLRIEICTSGIVLVDFNGYHIGQGDTIGKYIFLTREEAEQALKEREENG